MPAVAVRMRAWTLRRAAFVAARSPAAASLVRRWGAVGRVEVVPHPVPAWTPRARRQPGDGVFTVGYAGRLVDEKGIDDLLEALRMMSQPARLLAVGNGPLLGQVQAFPRAEVWTSCPHERMADAYGRMDVLVLPSRRTPRWEEQFGRVLVEALLCGVPVIGARTGEIPWVVKTTGGDGSSRRATSEGSPRFWTASPSTPLSGNGGRWPARRSSNGDSPCGQWSPSSTDCLGKLPRSAWTVSSRRSRRERSSRMDAHKGDRLCSVS